MTHSLWERERERERERETYHCLRDRIFLSEDVKKNLREQYTIVGFGSQVSFWILLFGVVERRWTKTVRWRCFGCSTCSILLCLLEDGSTTVLGTNPSISRKMDNIIWAFYVRFYEARKRKKINSPSSSLCVLTINKCLSYTFKKLPFPLRHNYIVLKKN